MFVYPPQADSITSIAFSVSCLSAGDGHVGGSSKDSGIRETITLKWCTPRTNSVGKGEDLICNLC